MPAADLAPGPAAPAAPPSAPPFRQFPGPAAPAAPPSAPPFRQFPGPAAPAAPPSAPPFRQFPVAWRFSLRNQARNRLAWLLLVAFVPVWYELMLDIAGHTPLTFKLYATGGFSPSTAGT